MGVRRAVEMALDAPGRHAPPIYTYGPLIHNPHVLNLLENKGITVLEKIPEKGTGTVLIRAHGVPPLVMGALKQAGFTVIDATCPRVIKVQAIINSHTIQDYKAIIVGDREHPEVMGLLGHAGEKGYVIDSLESLESLPPFEKAIIVAQTTQNTGFYEQVKDRVKQKYPHYKLFDTICHSTAKRQAEAKQLAEKVDTMIVVGGRNSGNTLRLAEVARQTGTPAYHIETETELDTKKLESLENIGVTAGASTPNWIIQRVCRSLEMLPLKKDKGWRRLFFYIQRFLLLTNIYVSIGAGSLCYACTQLLEINHFFPYVFIATLYVQSMHMLNNLTGNQADRFNAPGRAEFYKRNELLLAVLALSAGGAGLLTAIAMGRLPFLILLIMSIMGLSYNLRLVPSFFPPVKYARIRDIPGSKTLLITMAWGVVTTLFPYLSANGIIDIKVVSVFLWSASTVFVRTAFFDILDMQGDRIVGKETIPILLGKERTITLLKGMLIFILVILIIASVLNYITGLGFVLSVCPIIMFLIITGYDRGAMMPGIKLEFLLESHFIITGIITFIWQMMS